MNTLHTISIIIQTALVCLRNQLLWVVIGLSLVVLAAGICFWPWLSADTSNSEAARSIALTVGGIWAIYAVYLASERVRILQQQQISDSLAKAAEQLSSKMLSIRILAIRTLKNIAMTATDVNVCQDVVSVLCHYVRDSSPISDQQLPLGPMPIPHIEAILYELSEINTQRHEDVKGQLNLSTTDLSSSNLSGANLSGADLSGASLSGAILHRTDLTGANLSRANLSGVNLTATDLSYVNLSGANLSGANFSGTDLSITDLSRTNLTGANLCETDLSDARLSGANLSGANLFETNLSGANLSGASLSKTDLSEVDLSRANLSEANLSGANLYGTNLSRTNLTGANLSETDLTYANLSGAKLSGADLSHADVTSIHVDQTDFKDACFDKVQGLSFNFGRWETAVNLPPEVADRIIQYKKEEGS
ncbi:MAG: pentapeptide repeat-containing protein [Gammaproteobacteria bacterium]